MTVMMPTVKTPIHKLPQKWREEAAMSYAELAVNQCAAELEAALADMTNLDELVKELRAMGYPRDCIHPDDEHIFDKIADRIQSALVTQAAHQWQPIETAPKDGTEVIILEDGSLYKAFWCNTSSRFNSNHIKGHHRATHWTPLPPAPTPKSHD